MVSLTPFVKFIVHGEETNAGTRRHQWAATFENVLCAHLTFPVSFGRDIKSRWSLPSGVYARGSKRSHTGDKCVTCSGLNKSRKGQL